jgi:hypothetical protein
MTRDDTLAHVQGIRRKFRADGQLPVWTPEQWVTAVMIQLGDAAEHLHAEARDRERSAGIENLLAVAAICLDAAEALTGGEVTPLEDGDETSQ